MGVRDMEEGSSAEGDGWGPPCGTQGSDVGSGRVRMEGLESGLLVSLWFWYEGVEVIEHTFDYEGEE